MSYLIFLQFENMNKEGREPQEVDLKFLFKTFNDQFKMLNARLDDLGSSSCSKLPKEDIKHEISRKKMLIS